jgi:DNA-binding NarL/FixJ family response regulator
MKEAMRILLIGDQALPRAALRKLLESWNGFEVIGESRQSSEAVAAVQTQRPDIVLVDYSSQPAQDVEFLRKLENVAGEAHVVVLTDRSTDLGIPAERIEGTDRTLNNDLRRAMERVSRGNVWLERSMTAICVASSPLQETKKASEEEARIATLTEREREVARMVCEGLKNKQICQRLNISDSTVRHHLSAILGKLGVSNRFELTIFLYRYRFALPPVE